MVISSLCGFSSGFQKLSGSYSNGQKDGLRDSESCYGLLRRCCLVILVAASRSESVNRGQDFPFRLNLLGSVKGLGVAEDLRGSPSFLYMVIRVPALSIPGPKIQRRPRLLKKP